MRSFFQELPFNSGHYARMLLICTFVVLGIFGVGIVFFDYELTNADIPGGLIATPLLAYLVHLVVEPKE